MTRLLSCAAIVIFALPSVLLAQGSLEDLTKPIEGRSMRATSSFRGTLGSKTVIKNGKNATRLRPEGRFSERSRRGEQQFRQLHGRPGQDPRSAGRRGPGRHHAYLDHVPRPGAAGLGAGGRGQPSGNAAADLLRRQFAAGRRGAGGRFLRRLLRKAKRRSTACRS